MVNYLRWSQARWLGDRHADHGQRRGVVTIILTQVVKGNGPSWRPAINEGLCYRQDTHATKKRHLRHHVGSLDLLSQLGARAEVGIVGGGHEQVVVSTVRDSQRRSLILDQAELVHPAPHP